ncbi:MAG: hypothetical protein AAB611_01570 [Patescibacteria group bacterium]
MIILEKKKKKIVPNKVPLRKQAQEHVDTVREWKFAAISQLNFPELSRDYLPPLLKEVVVERKVQSVIIAGGILSGRFLENLLKSEIAENGVKGNEEKVEYRAEFVDYWARQLSAFLPVLGDGVNYHVISSPTIAYDATNEKGIGRQILLRLFEIRNEKEKDIRLYLDDAEPRVPIQWPKPTEIRVLVPQHKPWYSKLVSNLLQRLVNPFVARTFSDRPALILTGCTGSGVNIPAYKGIPALSVPAFYKINKVRSTESMVGCIVVTMRQKKGRTTYSVCTDDFRPFVAAERQSLIPEDMSPEKKRVLWHLSQNSQGFDTLHSRLYGFRADTKTPEKIAEEKDQLKKHLDVLIARNFVVFKPEINRYELSKNLAYEVKGNLAASLERAKRIRVVAYACLHVGALKTLYATFEHDMPIVAEDADALIDCGDTIQGLAHNFEYNGELVPTLNTYDKQSLKAAQIHANVLLQIFDRRFAKYTLGNNNLEEHVEKCLIKFIYCLGNHDMWPHYSKLGLPLWDFHREIVSLLIAGVMKRVPTMSYEALSRIVNEKIVRVGEKELIEINGIGVGVTHPHKGGAETKSARIQQVIESHVARKHPLKVVLELVGNFHTAAAIHCTLLNKTYVGIMLGAMLSDTQFEHKINKVVDHGPVVVTVWVDPRTGHLLRDEVEFFDDMVHPVDRRVIEADKLTESIVIDIAKRLAKFGDLPLR